MATSIVRPSVSALRQSCRVAAFQPRSPITALNAVQLQKKWFHATSRKDILPPLPQVVEGTTNDAAPIPPTSPVHGSYHWTFERVVAASLIPLTIAPFASGSVSPVLDAVLCGTIVIHSHIGFQAMIADYFRPWRVPKTAAFLKWLLRAATLTVSVGLYEFETNDVGITEALKRIWKA
ncbi:succinate dehydrogenase membrane anchor subunit [Arthroderma uncinatum]|uniref:succinate dehydrogenase membrane anchor subunit n=1 Tax=Arthroderma uncinatum TaxID=74035 RepID=UPI00144A7391|nr:succinate dehydrogenase membrane anchor subunit [Arthroderma uncinatum]KAF3481201.1 succinate dehydrogenase membrane anchor subunit [Arthroderma uncinatum]